MQLRSPKISQLLLCILGRQGLHEKLVAAANAARMQLDTTENEAAALALQMLARAKHQFDVHRAAHVLHDFEVLN